MYNSNKINRLLPLESNRLIYSTLRPSDINWYIKEILNPNIYIYWESKPPTNISTEYINYLTERIKHQLEENCGIRKHTNIEHKILITDKIYKQKIGVITIGSTGEYNQKLKSYKDVYLGYWIKEEYQHMGYATESLQKITNTLLNSTIVFERILLEVDIENEASKKVALKCGYRQSHIITSKDGRKHIIFSYEVR